MQKGSVGNNTKSKTNISMNESYTSPARKKFTQQSIRQFKIEIDHEIAKCLDTLDRQGLKFLKQTLRTSNMFSSANFQVQNENAKYQSQNSKRDLEKPGSSKISDDFLNKYYDQKDEDEIKESYRSKKKISPKKKAKPQTSHHHQEKQTSKYQSNIIDDKSYKEEASLKVKKDSVVSNGQKEKSSAQPSNKSFNKNTRSESSSKFNRTKQAYNQLESNQKPKEEKKYESAQTKSSAQVKQKQLPHTQNSNSRVAKKTIIENKKTNEKISLGQRLSKKMEELHISKVGPTKKTTNQAKEKTQIPNKKIQIAKHTSQLAEQTIEQQIIEGVQQQIEQEERNESNIHESIVSESIVQESFAEHSGQIEQSIKISQKINPLKPMSKASVSKQPETKQIEEEKKSKIWQNQLENSKYQSQSQVNQSNLMPNQSSSMNPRQSLIEKLSMSIQVDKSQIDRQSYESSVDKEKFVEMSHIVEKINKLSPDKLFEIQKYIQFIEKNPHEQFKSPESNIPTQIQTKDMETNKSQTFQNNWIGSHYHIKRPNTNLLIQEHLTQKQSANPNHSKPPLSIHRNDSRKGNRQKKQKASMIFNSHSKSASRSRIKIDADFAQEKNAQKESNFKKQSIQSPPQKPYIKTNSSNIFQTQGFQKVILTEQKPIKMEKIDFQQPKSLNLPFEGNADMKLSQMKMSKLEKEKIEKEQKNRTNQPQVQSPSKKLKQQKKLQLKSSQNIIQQQSPNKSEQTRLKIEYTEVKMLNVNTKRSMIKEKDIVEIKNRTKLKFKILSNRGHPSLFGLTGIELYTIDNRRVQITQKQLGLNSTSTAKLLHLFNGNHYTSKQDQFYQSALNKNQIVVELDKENDKIGGILVFNFNKSSLENDKEVNEMEIYHNDQKVWKGIINGGAYNQSTDYATKIQFMPNFRFPAFQIPNQSFMRSSKVHQSLKAPSQIANDKPLNQSKLIKAKPQNQVLATEKNFNASQVGQKINFPVENSSFASNERKRKSNNGPIIEQQKNQSTFSTKNFKFPESIENLNALSVKNDVKSSNIRLPPSSIQNAPKSQRNPSYDEFDSMLNGLQQHLQREKSKSKISQNPTIPTKPNETNLNVKKSQIQHVSIKKPDQKTTSQQIQDFVNASIFKEKSKVNLATVQKRSLSPVEYDQLQIQKKQKVQSGKNQDINIDDFLGQLQDVMKNKGAVRKGKLQKQIQIPNLPHGSLVQIQILQNWGHQALVGLHAIEFFDKNGTILTSNKIQSNKNHQNINLVQTLNNKNIMSRDEKIQTKLGFDRNSSTTLSFAFSSVQTFSLIRLWNYNGHRININIGIKFCLIKIDGKQAFMGEIKRNESTPENFHKHFDAIIFTSDTKIMKAIKENDWLTELRNKAKTQKDLFKSTLINFNRPKTRNSETKNPSKENQQTISSSKKQKDIKLHKRQCWQYEPPQMPQGSFLVFLLHDTWGDQNFIGLNGIEIFDGEGRLLTRDRIAKIKAFPNSTGESNDKRVVQNLIDGHNLSSTDGNIWLSTYQSDIEKIETGKPNTIIVELSKRTKISGINIFNYSKTPQRGVRQIEIQVNSMIAFRGYVKMFDEKSGDKCFHTTINFTKNVDLLANMSYEAYNQDNIDQNVIHVNERKTVKA